MKQQVATLTLAVGAAAALTPCGARAQTPPAQQTAPEEAAPADPASTAEEAPSATEAPPAATSPVAEGAPVEQTPPGDPPSGGEPSPIASPPPAPVAPATIPPVSTEPASPVAAGPSGRAQPIAAVPAEKDDATASDAPRIGATGVSFDLLAGLNGHARFSSANRSSSSSDVFDASFIAGVAYAPGPRFSLGLTYEYSGLGRETYAIDAEGQSLDTGYTLHALYVSGRWFLSSQRPSAYLAAGVGPALQRVRATGTESDRPFVDPGTPFRCAELGGLGAGLFAALGAEVDVSDDFSFLGQVGATGHLLPGGVDTFEECAAPGAGPTVQGTVRLGVMWRP